MNKKTEMFDNWYDNLTENEQNQVLDHISKKFKIYEGFSAGPYPKNSSRGLNVGPYPSDRICPYCRNKY